MGIEADYRSFFVNDTFCNTANVKCWLYHATYNKLPSIICNKANMARIMIYPTYGADVHDIHKRNKKTSDVDPQTLCIK